MGGRHPEVNEGWGGGVGRGRPQDSSWVGDILKLMRDGVGRGRPQDSSWVGDILKLMRGMGGGGGEQATGQ